MASGSYCLITRSSWTSRRVEKDGSDNFPDLIGQLAGVPIIPERPPDVPFGKPDFRRPANVGKQISMWGSQDDCLGFRNIVTDAGS